ncbi:NAD-dependent dehydratase [Kribbella sp. NPDC051952]|uniref:NAD-dependent dehydratase n=1 Tax=Kribbella sp. NPDC051952 TaxID=3154851 RepID=UPI0034147CCE
MKLLVLGGTKNLGRHVVSAALRDGHEVTLFNRGRTNPSLFPSVRRLTGERADPGVLATGEWDGVIDMSGFLVRDVGLTADVLRDRVGHYTFMSSIAVYAGKSTPGMTESARLLPWPPGAPEDHFTMDLYGPSKVRCESLLADVFGSRTSAVRSGFVVGPYNPDFGNWGSALAHGTRMECAARPDQPIQYIDARDLADFLLLLTVNRVSGPFNAVSPTQTMAELADAWRSVVPDPAPMDWSPAVDRFHLTDDGLFQLDTTRAVAAGLRLRADEESARDYVAWVHDGNIPPAPPH